MLAFLLGLGLGVGASVRLRLASDWTSILPDGHAYIATAWQWFFDEDGSDGRPRRLGPHVPLPMREQSPGSCRPPGYPLFLAAVTPGPILGPPSLQMKSAQ